MQHIKSERVWSGVEWSGVEWSVEGSGVLSKYVLDKIGKCIFDFSSANAA